MKTSKNEDCCVCCGRYVPEGRHICIACEREELKERQRLGYAPLPYWKQCLLIIKERFRRRRK